MTPSSLLDPEVAAIHQREAVHTVLQVLRRTLGLRVALVTKLSEGKFVACAAVDEAGYGLRVGDELEVAAAYCGTVCTGGGEPAPLIINRASADPRFRDHPALKRFGVESYIAVPLFRPDGSLLGTLCALDNRPAQLAPEDLNLLRLLSQLVTYEIQSADEMELLRRTEQFRSEVIGSLSHDLRNPAAVIRLSTQSLRQALAPVRELMPSLALIEQSADRLNRMIRDLMDFTQTRLGSPFPLQTQPADLHDLCLRAVREQQALYPGREIRFELGGDGRAECDPDRILQVFSNLLGNALLYSPEGSAVEVRVDDAPGGIVLEVSNPGPPIPPDLLPVMFQPFVRGERKAGGMGLGLYIVDQIVRAHGGTIAAESGPAAGTTFRAVMPLK